MENPEISRSQAITCLLLAEEAKDSSYKLMLLSIAQLWQTVAQTSEQVEALQSCGQQNTDRPRLADLSGGEAIPGVVCDLLADRR
jgi:hypothetical protein